MISSRDLVRGRDDAPHNGRDGTGGARSKAGFATGLLFVATDSVDENIARVLQRAQGGGHGASERDVRAIHESSIANIKTAVATFERVHLYDSTARWTVPRLVASTTDAQSVTAFHRVG